MKKGADSDLKINIEFFLKIKLIEPTIKLAFSDIQKKSITLNDAVDKVIFDCSDVAPNHDSESNGDS